MRENKKPDCTKLRRYRATLGLIHRDVLAFLKKEKYPFAVEEALLLTRTEGICLAKDRTSGLEIKGL